MRSCQDARRTATRAREENSSALASFSILLLFGVLLFVLPAHATTPPPITIAVFDFELEDVSAAGTATSGDTASEAARMQAVTAEARRVLAQSGRYRIVDTSGAEAELIKEKSLRSCNGCEVGIALKLGAERSLIGVVTRVAQTEYYVSVRLTDTATDKVVKQESAFFTGADDAWPSGAAMLLKHQVLAEPSH
jgi:hypothetical protein